MDRKLTKAQALRALEWARCEFGLHSWVINLDYGDDIPEWADSAVTYRTRLGRCQYWVADCDARIWVGPTNCDRNDQDRLVVLMHEVAHISLAKAGLDSDATDGDDKEFLCNRMGDLAAFAYRHKMKPWRR